MPRVLPGLLIAALIGLAAGSLAGLLGIGGGVLLTPLFVLLLGMDQHRAQGVSLAALILPVGLPALLAYRKNGVHVHVRLVGMLLVGFVGGSAAGAWLAHQIASRELRWAFVAFLLVSAWRTFQGTVRGGADGPGDTSPTPVSHAKAARGILIGLIAGVLSGLLGIGGAIIILPLLERFVGLKRLEAQATTLAMLLPPIGLPALFIYAKEDTGLPWNVLGAVVVAFAIGAAGGGIYAQRISQKGAKRVYAGFLVVVALLLLLGPSK